MTLPLPLTLGVFALWLVLATYALARLIVGLVRLEQLKRDALPLPIEYRDSMPQWLSANKGGRDVRLCVSDETDVPVAVGLFDAMILIPRTLLDHLSEPEVDQICLHELAHLRRADDWSNGAQRVIEALLGWNPAAQFIGQQLDLEREVACDDWVLSFVGKGASLRALPNEDGRDGVVAASSDSGSGRFCDAQTHLAPHRASARRGTQYCHDARVRTRGRRHYRGRAIALLIGVVAPTIASPSAARVVRGRARPPAPRYGARAVRARRWQRPLSR